MSGESEPPTTAPEKTSIDNATVRSTLGFRQLSRLQGHKWLSSIRRNTPKCVEPTHTSASAEQQTPVGVSTSQSQVINTTSVDESRTQDVSVMIIGDVMHQSTSSDSMPLEEVIQGQFDGDEQKKNAEGKTDSKLEEEPCIEKGNRDSATSSDVDRNDKMMSIGAVKSHSINGENDPQEEAMHCLYNILNVPVNDHMQQVQNDDTQQQKGNDYDDRNHVQENQGTKDTDQREKFTVECENVDNLKKLKQELQTFDKLSLEFGELCSSNFLKDQEIEKLRMCLKVAQQQLEKLKEVYHQRSQQHAAEDENLKLAILTLAEEPKKNADGKKNSNVDEESCIKNCNMDNATSCNVDRSDKMMTLDAVKSHSINDENNHQEEAPHSMYNTLIVPVDDHTHRMQNDDERHEKGNDYCDTNHNKKHQGTKDTDQQENITKECENGDNFFHQFDEDVQNKKVPPASGKTSGSGHYPKTSAPGYIDSSEYERQFGSGFKTTKNPDKLEPKKRINFAKHMSFEANGSLCSVQSNMCHQCQRNDKGRVVRCRTCANKRYCVPCMNTWYPNMTEDMFAERCPVCRGNCNCKQCLRDVHPWVNNKFCFITNNDEKVECAKNILQMLLPFLKHLNEERLREMKIEAEIKGCSISEVKLKKADSRDCRINCDCCKTSILDLHRSCPLCEYDLCLTCCQELRHDQLQGYKKAVTTNFTDPGPSYMYGELQNTFNKTDAAEPAPEVKEIPAWKSLKNSSIRCPPRSLGGCCLGILDLTHILPLDMVPSLLEKAQELLKSEKIMECMPKMCDSDNENDGSNKHLCKTSSRENSDDNYLYCPSAVDIESEGLKHFQCHWSKGEPVMVSNVLAMGSGLSWEPMVMCRSFRQTTDINHSKLLDTKIVNCLNWQVVSYEHPF